jgi:hypothetical protein
MEIYLKAHIDKNGCLVVENNDQASAYLYPHKDNEVIIRITPYERKASNRQMRWYWGVAVQTIIAEHKERTGEVLSKDEVHAYNLSEIVKPKMRTKEVLGQTVIQIDEFSLSKMNVKEFNVFKDKLQMYWAEKDIDIPDPNENELLNESTGTGYESLRNIKRADS